MLKKRKKKKRGIISILSGKALKLIGQFTYLGSNIPSTENNVSICIIAKVWATINWLSIIWKSDPSDKMEFLPSCGCVNTAVWIHHQDANETNREKSKEGTTQECYVLF